MDSEDKLLCVLAAVKIQGKKRKKKLRKRGENAGYGFSRFTEKE